MGTQKYGWVSRSALRYEQTTHCFLIWPPTFLRAPQCRHIHYTYRIILCDSYDYFCQDDLSLLLVCLSANRTELLFKTVKDQPFIA